MLPLCLVPPACTSAATEITLKIRMPLTSVSQMLPFVAGLGLFAWMYETDKPTLATLDGSKHWSFTKTAINKPSSCIEDVIYVTCRLSQGPTALFFFFFFTVSGQL